MRLTNINADDIGSIRPRVDVTIKTGAWVVSRPVHTLLRTVPIVHLAFIDIMTSHAISTQVEARGAGAAEWSSRVCACVITVPFPVVLSALVNVLAVARSAKKIYDTLVALFLTNPNLDFQFIYRQANLRLQSRRFTYGSGSLRSSFGWCITKTDSDPSLSSTSSFQ